MAGYPDFSETPRAKLLWKGVKNQNREEPRDPIQSPVMRDILDHICSATTLITKSYFEELLLQTCFTILYYRLLRPGELLWVSKRKNGTDNATIILRQDISQMNKKFTLRICAAKTAKLGKLQCVQLEKQEGPHCPISLLQKYLSISLIKSGLLLQTCTGGHLTYDYTCKKFQQITNIAGYGNQHLSLYSFRIGRATKLNPTDVPLLDILTKGRWVSDAVIPYIRTPRGKQPGFCLHLKKLLTPHIKANVKSQFIADNGTESETPDTGDLTRLANNFDDHIPDLGNLINDIQLLAMATITDTN